MKKVYLFFLFQLMLFSVKGQITGPSTATVGTPVSFSGPAGQASYTWSPTPTNLDMNSTLPRTTLASFPSGQLPLYTSIVNDNGHWYALFVMYQVGLFRLDLGTDPTVPTTNTPVNIYPATAECTSGGFIYDGTTGSWHGFLVYTATAATNNLSRVDRVDFGNSIANTPTGTTLNVQRPIPTDLATAPCDLNLTWDNGEYFLFVASRWNFPVRISFGSDITNATPTATNLPGPIANNAGISLYKQGNSWYGLAVSVASQALWRYDFGTSLNNTPTLNTVGSNVIGNTNNWSVRVIPGNCGDQLLAYVVSGNNVRRLNFNGDITNTPTVTTGLLATNFGGTQSYSGYPFVFNGKVYGLLSSLQDRAISCMELSVLPASTEQIYHDPVFTHTFSSPGTYDLSLITGLYGQAPAVSCHTVTVQGGPPPPPPAITIPDTVCVNEPFNLSSGVSGNSFTWIFDSLNVHSDITTSTTTKRILMPYNVNMQGAITPLKYDSTNGRYYAFWGNWNANTIMYRLDFGANPLSTPVVTTVSLVGMGFTGTSNGHMDVVRDDVSGDWHLFWAGSGQQLLRVDFGNSLGNTPVGGATMNFTGSNGLAGGFQITFKKYKGEWIMFSANNGGPNISRLDFGASLTNTNPTVTILPNTLSFTHPGYFSLYEQDGDWHLFFVTTAAVNRPSYRYDFGPDLKNNTPSLTFTGATGGIMKSIRMLPNAVCSTQLFGYGVDESGRLVKFDYSGDVNTNTPAISGVGTFFSGRPIEMSTIVYNDTLYAVVTEINNRDLVTIPLLPLPEGSIQKYYDPAATHTFTTPGVHTVTLMVDQGDPAGPATYCKKIVVQPGTPGAPPGPFTDSAISVLHGQQQVRYAIPPVAGATGYDWAYTGTGATINGSDTAITIDFSSTATSGVLSVIATGPVGNCGGTSSLARELSVMVKGLPIIIPDTVCVNEPFNLSSGAGGNSFAWIFDSLNVQSDITTATVSRRILLNHADLQGSVTPLKYDSSNGRYYSFWGNWNANTQIYRLDFGTNPLSTPVVTTVSLAGMGFTGTNNGGMDVVRDDVSGNWHLFWAGSGQQLLRVDFGNSLGNTPSGGTTMNFTSSNGMPTAFQITFKKYNGEWLLFSANNGGPTISRLDFGASLTNPNPSVTIFPKSINFTHPGYFSLYEQDGDWHLFFVTTAAAGRPSYRYDFGPDLKNNTPTLTATGSTGTGVMKGIKLFPNTACNNQLFGYGVDESRNLIKFNYSGDMTTTPVISGMGDFFGTRPVEISTFVYNDTLYALVTEFTVKNLAVLPLFPFPSGTIQKYYDPATTHTFTTPGVHTVTLMVDQGDPAGPTAYCREIVVESGGIASTPPGPFTDSAVNVCHGQQQVRYAIPPVAGATGYDWAYTGTGATINGSDTAITIDFSSLATDGVLSVIATGPAGDCGGTSSLPRELSITVNAPPTVSIGPATVTVCDGQSATLTASGATTYSWSHSGGSNAAATYTPSSTTTYTVTGTSSGCSATATRQVTVTPLPTVSIGPATVTVCDGQSATLTASGATTYSWSHSGGSNAVATYSPSSTTTYTVTGTSSGCSATASRQVTVTPLPTVSISPATVTVCNGQSAMLTASGATTYSWSHSGGSNTAATYTPSSTTTYTVTGTSSGCSATATRQVTVTPLPTVSISPATVTVCNGQSAMLTASGATTYSWSHSGGSNAAATYAPSSTTTYTVTGTSSGCSATATRQVTVTPLPTVSISPATVTICDGQSAMLTASGATTYSWSHSGGSNAAATYSPSSTTTYTVTGTSSGCSATATRQVVVTPLPAVSISPAIASVCAGGSITLTASGATTYSWSHSGGSNAVATYTPSSTTTYTVTGTSSGCSTTATRQVTHNPLPVTQIMVTGNTDICIGDSTVLTASGSGYNYEWKDGSGIAGSGSSFTVYATGSYKVVATDAGSGCSDSTQEVEIRVYDRPAVLLDQNDTSFCIGGIVMLEVATQDTGLTYIWKQDEATIPLAAASFLEINEGGVYKVIVGRSQVASCEDSTNEVTITVHDLPVVHTTWDGETLHATPGYASYQWNAGSQGIVGATDSTYTPSSNGGYSVTVTDGNGCENTSPVQNLTNVSVAEQLSLIHSISVYPNPSGGVVHIESSILVDVIVFSMDGRLLQRVADAHQVDLSSYADGMYMLRIVDKEGIPVHNERIVKK